MSNIHSLYSKYRPQKFKDVVGQEIVKRILINSIVQKKINHSYLFYGIRGVGKTTLARIFSKSLNCLNSNDYEPCDNCESCLSILNGSNLDVIEIDAATNNGVDEIRDISEKSNYSTTSSKYKIYIIDEVHCLSKLAFNALLKTLEEPPRNTIFLLATTEIYKIPETILSRTLILNLETISDDYIIDNLKNILKKEKIFHDQEAIKYISFISGGSMRDAISNLETIILFSEKVTEKNVVDSLRVLSFSEIENLIFSKKSFLSILKDRKIDYLKVLNLMVNYLSSKIEKLNVSEKKILNDLIDININLIDQDLIKIALIKIFELKKLDNKNLDLLEKKEETKKINLIEKEKPKKPIEDDYNLSQKIEKKYITDLFEPKHYLTIFFNQDEKKLKTLKNKFSYLTSYLNNKKWIKYINIFYESDIYLCSKNSAIFLFHKKNVYEEYKKISLNKELFEFIKELFGEDIVILPTMEKQLKQLNIFYEKIKKENKIINEEILHQNEKNKIDYSNFFGKKLIVEDE